MSHLSHLRTQLKDHKLNGFLVTKAENVRYLTGFSGSFGMVLVQKSGPHYLITDSRYQARAEEICDQYPGREKLQFQLFDKEFGDTFGAKIKGNYATEKTVTLRQFDRIKQKWFKKAKWTSLDNLVEDLRTTKTKEEIEYTTQAATHTSEVLEKFLQSLFRKPDISESEAAFMLENMLRDGGNYELAFPAIVAFGENSSVPHHSPSHRTLIRNENILVDCGAKYQGYCADITRNFWFGAKVDPEYRERHENLLSIQRKALKKFVTGTKTADLHQAVLDNLNADAQYFTHSLGHGTGLEIHEAPSISSRSEEALAQNQIVTCEPGVYYPKKFGIRIEDQIVVKKRFAQSSILSTFEKELIVLMPPEGK